MLCYVIFGVPDLKLPGVDSYATTKSSTWSSLIVIATKHNPDKQAFLMFCYQESLISSLTPWRNGSASDSRSEGCVFESRRVQNLVLFDCENGLKSIMNTLRSHQSTLQFSFEIIV